MEGSRTTTVAVFYDWQNAYKTAREAFRLENMPNERGNFSPYKLAMVLAAGNGRGPAGNQLVRVEVHRGRPSQRYDPTGYAANRRQAAAWEAERPTVVKARLRSLRYPRNYPAEPVIEKGVDVQLGISAVDCALSGDADVAIIFSHDSDLAPVPELIARRLGVHRVETASWAAPGFHQKLAGINGVHHHSVSKAVFNLIETPINYAHPGPRDRPKR